jgi:hypothetical protein
MSNSARAKNQACLVIRRFEVVSSVVLFWVTTLYPLLLLSIFSFASLDNFLDYIQILAL